MGSSLLRVLFSLLWFWSIEKLFRSSPPIRSSPTTTNDVTEETIKSSSTISSSASTSKSSPPDIHGLTYRLYDNAALAGSPVWEGTTLDAELSLTSSPSILSGELEGSITFTTIGKYTFYCTLEYVSMGFVWVDGHLVCRDTNTYDDGRDEMMDGPLQITTNALHRKSTYPFRAHIMTNGSTTTRDIVGATGTKKNIPRLTVYMKRVMRTIDDSSREAYSSSLQPAETATHQSIAGSKAVLDEGFQLLKHSNSQQSSGRSNTVGDYAVSGSDDRVDLPPLTMPLPVVTYLHPKLPQYEQHRESLQRRLRQDGWGYWLRNNILSIVKIPDGLVLSFAICRHHHHHHHHHQRNDTSASDELFTGGNASNDDCLYTASPDSEGIVRVDLHAYDRSYIGYNVTFGNLHVQMECSVSTSSSVNESIIVSQYDPTTMNDRSSNHSNNNSYYYYYNDTKVELRYLITASPLDDTNNDVDDEIYYIQILPRYAWFRPGNISFLDDNNGISFSTPGLGVTNFTVVKGATRGNPLFNDNDGGKSLLTAKERPIIATKDKTKATSMKILLWPGSQQREKVVRASQHSTSVAFVAGLQGEGPAPTVDEIRTTIHSKRDAEYKRLRRKFGPQKAAIAEAIQCAVMWTCIYNPVENGPFLPVSRSPGWSFATKSGASTSDWSYVIFDWDNLFASLLAGLDDEMGKDIAYSNLFQVVKSKTSAGFIPNWSTAGVKSQDRTEPPIGARVLWELYLKYNDTWLVEALFDDLMDWNDWFLANRLLQPLGLVALGSHYSRDSPYDASDIMQAARWESGLDNSPMYDGNCFDNTTHMMQMYDVGMSSLVAQEAYSLARLADVIGRGGAVSTRLRERGAAMRDLISQHLWDTDRQVFANRRREELVPNRSVPIGIDTNGTASSASPFVQHITPTSFYPMLVGAHPGSVETPKTAAHGVYSDMVQSYLLNSTRFCLSMDGDFVGNDPERCYWGLPSVSADDPTYMEGNFVYWRGLTWGPMSMLVYWSLFRHQEDGDVDCPCKFHSTNLRLTLTARMKDNPVQTRCDCNIGEQSVGDDTIKAARRSLCTQMGALMMSQWESNRHICENYSPYKNATGCSGTPYYHWGALNGLIGMMEDGFW